MRVCDRSRRTGGKTPTSSRKQSAMMCPHSTQQVSSTEKNLSLTKALARGPHLQKRRHIRWCTLTIPASVETEAGKPQAQAQPRHLENKRERPRKGLGHSSVVERLPGIQDARKCLPLVHVCILPVNWSGGSSSVRGQPKGRVQHVRKVLTISAALKSAPVCTGHLRAVRTASLLRPSIPSVVTALPQAPPASAHTEGSGSSSLKFRLNSAPCII